MAGLGVGERVALAVESRPVVGHPQLDLAADRPQRDRDRVRARVAAGVHDGLLRDPEERPRALRRELELLERYGHLKAKAPLPGGEAVLDRGLEGELLEGVRPE